MAPGRFYNPEGLERADSIPAVFRGKETGMRRAIWLLALLVPVAAGCTTVQVNPLAHELNYQFTPAPDPVKAVDKALAVVPFADGRMLDGNNVTRSTSAVWNCLPFVWRTVAYDSHPEVTYNSSVGGAFSRVKVAGTLADALPELLAAQLGRSRRFAKVAFVEASEVRDRHSYDYVLRGKLVESKLESVRLSYGLGPAALVPHLLGLPLVRYTASLTVEWQLFDSAGNAVGPRVTETLDKLIVRDNALYYGWTHENKDMPFGLYVEAARSINTKIEEKLMDLVLR